LLDNRASVIRRGSKVEEKEDIVIKSNIEVISDVESNRRVVLSSTLKPSRLFKVGRKVKGEYNMFSEGNLEVEYIPLPLGER